MAIIKPVEVRKSLTQIMNGVYKKSQLTSGKDCPDNKDKALFQMQTIKELWLQTDGREYKYYIQSFLPGETTIDQANKIGLKWAELSFLNYEVFIGTCAIKDHIHNHFIVNSVNYFNGKKLHLSKKDLTNFRNISDVICKKYGLSVIDNQRASYKGSVRAYKMKKYEVIKAAVVGKRKSYIWNIYFSINAVLKNVRSKEEFIKDMEIRGYKVNIEESYKHINFTDALGNKVRALNLEKTFSDPSISIRIQKLGDL